MNVWVVAMKETEDRMLVRAVASNVQREGKMEWKCVISCRCGRTEEEQRWVQHAEEASRSCFTNPFTF